MIFDFIGVNAYNAWYGKSFRALWRRGCSPLSFPLQQDPVNGDGTVFRVSVDAFHTVVADFFRIQITAVAFTATDAFRGTLWSRVPSERISFERLQAFKIPDGLTVEADGKRIDMYDYPALQTRNQYNFFQGGNHGILTVANPNAKSGKTLLILKDSFANSFLPCIVGDYAKIIMVDERYAFIDAGQLAVDSGADEIAVIREIISAG